MRSGNTRRSELPIPGSQKQETEKQFLSFEEAQIESRQRMLNVLAHLLR